jgi:hypothetical protein
MHRIVRTLILYHNILVALLLIVPNVMVIVFLTVFLLVFFERVLRLIYFDLGFFRNNLIHLGGSF